MEMSRFGKAGTGHPNGVLASGPCPKRPQKWVQKWRTNNHFWFRRASQIPIVSEYYSRSEAEILNR